MAMKAWVVMVLLPEGEMEFHAVAGEAWTEAHLVKGAFMYCYPQSAPPGSKIVALPAEEFYEKMHRSGKDEIVELMKQEFEKPGVRFDEDPDSRLTDESLD